MLNLDPSHCLGSCLFFSVCAVQFETIFVVVVLISECYHVINCVLPYIETGPCGLWACCDDRGVYLQQLGGRVSQFAHSRIKSGLIDEAGRRTHANIHKEVGAALAVWKTACEEIRQPQAMQVRNTSEPNPVWGCRLAQVHVHPPPSSCTHPGPA